MADMKNCDCYGCENTGRPENFYRLTIGHGKNGVAKLADLCKVCYEKICKVLEN